MLSFPFLSPSILLTKVDSDSDVIDTPMVRNVDTQSEHINMDRAVSMAPMNRIGRPEEVGEAVCWLLCEGSGFVTGSVQAVDGGWMA